ncbi:MAG: hypothetical protein F6K63_14690 [Moorea sp. SIO1G6]|uniref:hypothetical protein n=1 Tax=Moorena sp. SIO1G6 TaxID=2607840 RepID=UPI0013C0E964|nr:hypothetical protein [Moorena sp. SIO1G6]NET65562.1 hypothetical protein [Moorena sp. SIO1G6]
MPGFVLSLANKILCAHGGQVQPMVPNPRVKVMGQPVLTQAPTYVVAGCANPPPPANVGPCLIASWITGSVRVKVMGMPVLLQDAQATCVPTGTPVTVIPMPGRVKGM